MFMKKIQSVFLCMLLVSMCVLPCAAAEELPPMQVEIAAKAGILVDADSGKVFMAQNAHDRLYPASVTKIMTLLLVVEAIDEGRISLNDTVTAGREAREKGGSQIWLEEGEQMTVDELLKAAAVASANDACEALAEYVAGSSAAFVNRMNERAEELGMHDTNFENCTGLDDTAENHKTSAYDIALMSRELLKHQRIVQYTTIWMDSLRDGKTELTNTNKLVRFYEGATGLKTGTTSKAGCCVAASAERDGLHLIAVVLGSDSSDTRFNSARAMLDWGFANYESVALTVDSTQIPAVSVLHGMTDSIQPQIPETKKVVLEKGKKSAVMQEIDLAASVEAPVEAGQLLGRVIFQSAGETVCTYDLTNATAVERLTFAEAFRRILCILCQSCTGL